MAVDEALLLSTADGGLPVMRFYEWEQATLSLGYFQALADRRTHAASTGAPLVRRQTGGGAIVHDRELTYSLVIPPAHPLAADTQSLYDRWHGSLLDVLRELGADARLCPAGSGLAKADEPFLCFERRAVGDVLLGDAKITGSAQRRTHGAVLQHGSILLQQSPAAPQLPGIAELSGVILTAEMLIARWTERLQAVLGIEFHASELTAAEHALAESIAREKYGSHTWTARR